jgi:UDP-glucose 4-epimerase
VKVLITGGAGFVGRHFVKRLEKISKDITLVDDLIQGGGGLEISKWSVAPASFVQHLKQDCRKFFETDRTQYDLVIHLAAVVGGRMTIERNPLAVAEDLSIDACFWKWAIVTNPGHIISFSSSAAYPVHLQNEPSRLLIESDIDFEKIIGVPDLTYGWAKLTNEYIGLIAAQKYGLKVASYRPFSGYGPDQSLSYPFPSICLRALERKGSADFEVWGSGLQKRDFIHIDDLVDAVMSTYSVIDDGTSTNLCTGQGTSFVELAELACQIVGYSPKVHGQKDMPEGVFSRIGDPTKLNALGWNPKISLQQGVEECLDFLVRTNTTEGKLK